MADGKIDPVGIPLFFLFLKQSTNDDLHGWLYYFLHSLGMIVSYTINHLI
jgi:hypothetical protein